MEDSVRSQNSLMGDLCATYYLCKEKIVFASQLIKSNHRVDNFGVPVFAPEYNVTILVAEICSSHHEHSI